MARARTIVHRGRAAIAASVPELRSRPLHVAMAAAVVGLLLGGAVLADARLAALDRTALTEQLGHAATVRVSLLEPSRAGAFGGRTAIMGLGRERVLLRAPARVRFPAVVVGEELEVAG